VEGRHRRQKVREIPRVAVDGELKFVHRLACGI
jgi:hypothetical protein